MKFFCIGLTKTGTTSINGLMASLGYEAQGFSGKLLDEYLTTGGIGPKIERAIRDHDAFDDWPWPFLYRELLEMFGRDAIFILTRRRSPEAWLASIKRYSLNSRTQTIRQKTYGTQFPHGFEEHYLLRYKTHLDEVRTHFKTQGAVGQLIDAEIGSPELLTAIAAAINKPVGSLTLPHQNATKPRKRLARQNIEQINKALLGLGKTPISLQDAGYRTE